MVNHLRVGISPLGHLMFLISPHGQSCDICWAGGKSSLSQSVDICGITPRLTIYRCGEGWTSSLDQGFDIDGDGNHN